ncbi:ribosome silencing factor [Crocinitomix catalasitica]|mgnify:CR=1 FL=1|uniref:ribosome silencing factor n=1 Tax=Crocinitomix catalasitica TaxID=184607 RepID=UPI0004818B52|nr:ribosome silencing factor [Crocinitomix catalasitica]|tara:strand:- start:22 stop:405 length:384 start_codon:yes stop_codon:yes gene_type:complete
MQKTVGERELKTKILVDTIVDGIQEVKGKDITILNLSELPNAVADFFIICSGESSTQVEAIAQSVTRTTRKEIQEKPWHQEGVRNAEWILLDYVNVVLHVFYKDIRSFYNLESLWADAELIEIPNID